MLKDNKTTGKGCEHCQLDVKHQHVFVTEVEKHLIIDLIKSTTDNKIAIDALDCLLVTNDTIT